MSLKEKLEVIKCLDKHEHGIKLALEFGVGKATISIWRKNHATIEQFCTKMSTDTVEKGEIQMCQHSARLTNHCIYGLHKKGKRNSLKWTTHTRKG